MFEHLFQYLRLLYFTDPEISDDTWYLLSLLSAAYLYICTFSASVLQMRDSAWKACVLKTHSCIKLLTSTTTRKSLPPMNKQNAKIHTGIFLKQVIAARILTAYLNAQITHSDFRSRDGHLFTLLTEDTVNDLGTSLGYISAVGRKRLYPRRLYGCSERSHLPACSLLAFRCSL